MSEKTPSMRIEELADSVGVSVRTVRFYITQNLIPGPGSRGKSAAYGEEHLLRLRLVRRLSEQRVPLADIREQTTGLSLEEVRSLLKEETQRQEGLQRAVSPKEYVSEILCRARSARAPNTRLMPQSPHLADVSVHRTLGEGALRSRPAVPCEAWRRWELVPGIELHVSTEVEERNHGLIERLLKAAGESRDP